MKNDTDEKMQVMKDGEFVAVNCEAEPDKTVTEATENPPPLLIYDDRQAEKIDEHYPTHEKRNPHTYLVAHRRPSYEPYSRSRVSNLTPAAALHDESSYDSDRFSPSQSNDRVYHRHHSCHSRITTEKYRHPIFATAEDLKEEELREKEECKECERGPHISEPETENEEFLHLDNGSPGRTLDVHPYEDEHGRNSPHVFRHREGERHRRITSRGRPSHSDESDTNDGLSLFKFQVLEKRESSIILFVEVNCRKYGGRLSLDEVL